MAGTLSKASIVWLIATLLFGVVALVSLFKASDREDPALVGFPTFDLQGHRGARGYFPENTLPGFRGALALGVTTLEMDLGMTRDGVIVVHHDLRLSPARTRHADGTWLAAPGPALTELDLATLAHYDVGRLRPGGREQGLWPQQQGFDGLRIPTLTQAIALAEAVSSGRVRYSLETKVHPLEPEISPEPEVFAAALVAELRQAEVERRALIQSFDWRVLAKVQEIAAEIPTVYLTSEAPEFDTVRRGRPGASVWLAGLDVDRFDASLPRAIRAAGGAIWAPRLEDLREADLYEARRHGLRVVVWTVNDPAVMESLLDLGVDGIVTDYPDRLRAVLSARGMDLPPAFAQHSAPQPDG